jgi:hypothetical protein
VVDGGEGVERAGERVCGDGGGHVVIFIPYAEDVRRRPAKSVRRASGGGCGSG